MILIQGYRLVGAVRKRTVLMTVLRLVVLGP